MNPFRSTSARSYQDIGLETSIGSASPHQLILMLYDAALNAIGEARLHMRSRNIAAKGAAISRAIRVIGEGLWASLDMDRGGSLAAQMGGLYAYMSKRLVEANLHNREEMLTEVQGLLSELRSAWAQIGARPAPQVAPMAMSTPPRDRRAVSYGAV